MIKSYKKAHLIGTGKPVFTVSMNEEIDSRELLSSTSLSKKNQEKEVASHYDIGNDFYSLWLDDNMSYSCGYFKTDQDTLYEAQCNKVERILKKLCLKEDMTLLHFISALKEYPGDPWMKKHIFPGGMVPSLREMVNLLSEHKFYILDVESLRRHYYKTLRHWDQNFNEIRDQIEKKMGTGFVRMWDLYLNACAATFHNGIIDLHQILISKGINNEIPLTR